MAVVLGFGLLLPGGPAAAGPPTAPTPAAVDLRVQVPPAEDPAPDAPRTDPRRSPTAFQAPVDAAVTDGWRPPSTPYGAGNRGWQYGTVDGDPVRAAGAGTVTFAGHVGGVEAVTITHRGGLRTSYTRLATVHVAVNDAVRGGQLLGTALADLHFGVRLGERYVDPGVLFEPGALRYGARLLPS